VAYEVKEIFYSLQGEGAQTGRPAVFCRFAGCNLWSGLEKDRAKSVCQFCDTDFRGTDGKGGGSFDSARELAGAVFSIWPRKNGADTRPFVVCTGGEPLLQLDAKSIKEFHALGFEIAVETNGTIKAPPNLDWICVSPKAGTELAIRSGDELKLVYPQEELDPGDFINLKFDHFFLQPLDGPDAVRNTKLALEYCLEHPRWRLSLQTHKFLGIR
jgi:7-carboxy-7-deazaguanine synthase